LQLKDEVNQVVHHVVHHAESHEPEIEGAEDITDMEDMIKVQEY